MPISRGMLCTGPYRSLGSRSQQLRTSELRENGSVSLLRKRNASGKNLQRSRSRASSG